MAQETIWKFDLEVTDLQTIEIPSGADILAVQTQAGSPKLWAAVHPDNPKEKRTFLTMGTGNPIPDDFPKHFRKHIGTYQMNGGGLIFHVFEVFL